MAIQGMRETEVFFREVEKGFNVADLIVGRTMTQFFEDLVKMGEAFTAIDWPDELKEFRRKMVRDER